MYKSVSILTLLLSRATLFQLVAAEDALTAEKEKTLVQNMPGDYQSFYNILYSTEDKITIANKEAFDKRYDVIKNASGIERQLGSGEFSTVMLIVDKQVNKAKGAKNNTDEKVAELSKKPELYALKKVTIKRPQDGETAAKLEWVRNVAIALREVYIWRKLGVHKRIVTLHEVYANGEDLFLVLDLAGAGELFDVMNFLNIQNPSKKLTMDQALFYLSEIVEALKHIHSSGIIYHDLKPENILLGLDGHVYLTDMGVADKVNADGVSYVSGGTSEFMAPEIFNNEKHAHTKKADIFSLGALTIYMLTNQSIFRATKTDPKGNEVDKYEDKVKQAAANAHNIKTQVISKEVLKTMVKTHGLPDDENLREFLEKCLQHDVIERPTIEGVEDLTWLKSYRTRVPKVVKPPFRVAQGSMVKPSPTVFTRIASKKTNGILYTLF